MVEELNKAGIFIDDICCLRVLDPKIATETNELIEACDEYSKEIIEFQKYVDEFVQIFNNFAKLVEKEKLRAIHTKNLLKTIPQQRETKQQQFQSQILEKTVELERLKLELQNLQRVESEQQEVINTIQNQ